MNKHPYETDYPTGSQRSDHGNLTFTGSSRIFQGGAGGAAHAAADEGAQGVAAGGAGLTVVLLVLTLVVICTTSEGSQDMVTGSRGLSATQLPPRWMSGRGVENYGVTAKWPGSGEFRRQGGTCFWPASGHLRGPLGREGSWSPGCWADQQSSSSGDEQAASPSRSPRPRAQTPRGKPIPAEGPLPPACFGLYAEPP